MKIYGLEDLADRLNDLARRAGEINGQTVDFSETLTEEFMAEHTALASLDALLASSSWKVAMTEDFAAIPLAQWDGHIAKETSFASWEEMQRAAATEYFAERLGFSISRFVRSHDNLVDVSELAIQS